MYLNFLPRVNKYLEPDKSFAIYRVDPPYKPITRKGPGKKMGGGKAPIHHYETPVKAGRIILEVGGKIMWDEVRPWLKKIAGFLPFDAIPVSQDLLDRLEAEEQRLIEVEIRDFYSYLKKYNIMFNFLFGSCSFRSERIT